MTGRLQDGGAGRARRLEREERTIVVMVGMYCRAHHSADGGPCTDCDALLTYARRRLAACRFGADKPICSRCPVHCYAPVERERIREVMRFSGPRMLKRHPVLGLAHLLDGRHECGDVLRRGARRSDDAKDGGEKEGS
jgi:hypothetical protein